MKSSFDVGGLRFLAAALALILLIMPGVARAAAVEAKKEAEVYAEPTNKSQVIGKLDKGKSLPAVERKGMFWEVKYEGGKTGYVSVLAVAHKADDKGGISDAIKDAVKEGRGDDGTDGRQRSAVMGVRGLAPDDDMAKAGDVRPNLRAVFQMEDLTVSEKKVQALGEQVFKDMAEANGG